MRLHGDASASRLRMIPSIVLTSSLSDTTVTGDFFGTKNLGVNYGLLFTAWGVAGIIGPIIAGRLFDIFGNYTNAFYVGSGICILALGSLLLAKRPEAQAVAGVEEVKAAKRAA